MSKNKHQPPVAPKRMRIPKERRSRLSVDTGQLGTSALRQFNGFLREEFLRDLQGPDGARRYREMRDNDPVLGAMLNGMEFFLFQTAFPIVPMVKDDPASEACAQFVRECLDDMEHSFQDMLSEFATCFHHGHSEHEKVFKVRAGDSADPTRNSRFNDGRIGWRKIALRSQTSIYQWRFDTVNDPDKPTGFVQITETGRTCEVPLDRCVHFRIKADLNNPEGRSLIRNCHKPYTFVSGLQEIEAIMLERACGFPVLPVPASMLDPSSPDATVADALLDALSQIRYGERSAILVPHSEENGIKTGYGELKFERAPGALPDINATIQRWESRMAMTLLMDFIMLGHNGDGGNRAMHTDKTSLFGKSLAWLADMFCSTFTAQAIHHLCKMNGFPQAVWPRMSHGPVVPVSLGEFADYVNKMVGCLVLQPSPNLEAEALRQLDVAPEDLSSETAPA